MADTIKNIELGEVTYPIEDETARADASEAKSAASSAQNTANRALTAASSAQNTANSALTAVSSKVGARYESSSSTLVLE